MLKMTHYKCVCIITCKLHVVNMIRHFKGCGIITLIIKRIEYVHLHHNHDDDNEIGLNC